MNDFVSKYKSKMAGANPKQIKQDGKKAITKALHTTFKNAMDGQIAGIQHHGVQYLMMRQDVFNDLIKNGGQLLSTDEQKAFHKEYQILLQIQGSLNLADPVESELHDEVELLNFDFSQHMQDPKAAKKRKEILKEFHETIESHELLTTLRTNLLNQMNPKKEEVENNGKLT